MINMNGVVNKIPGLSNPWTFMETIAVSGCIVIAYLLVVLIVIPRYMKNRIPFQLKEILLFYNVFQVLLSMYNVYLFLAHASNYSLLPSKCWKDNSAGLTKSILRPILCYLVAKHLDLLDTVFFVLRKKDNQVTFLHVYHHSLMLAWSWLYYKFFPTDIYMISAMLNCIVHVIMYTYYALASLGPKFAKYIWWKKYLTKLQLTQFILIICNLFYQQKTSSCPLSSASHWYGVGSIAIFFLLFMNFYIRSYFAQKTKKVN